MTLIRLAKSSSSEEGASAVEYGLILAAIAAVIILAVFAFGGAVQGLFQNTCNSVAAQTSQSC